jgi:hypothetical protein
MSTLATYDSDQSISVSHQDLVMQANGNNVACPFIDSVSTRLKNLRIYPPLPSGGTCSESFVYKPPVATFLIYRYYVP